MPLALVTGGDRGIGFAIARMLGTGGYEVVIAARDRKRLADAEKSLSARGVKAHSFACDVTSRRDVARLAKSVSGLGGLDLLVNDAGVAFNKQLLENSDEEIDLMLDVNLRGLISCTRAFLPGMVGRGKGVIINISSGAGKAGFPGLAVYCATKFGVIGLTESLAGEVSGSGVRVYAICPGATETDMWRSLYPGEAAEFVPDDVAREVMDLLKNAERIRPGSAIDVRKR